MNKLFIIIYLLFSINIFGQHIVGGDLRTEGSLTPAGNLKLPMGKIDYFDVTGTLITISAQSDGSTNMVLVVPDTTILDNDSLFDMPQNGRLRYVGTQTRSCHISATVSYSPSQTNDVFIVGIAHNNTVSAKILDGIVGIAEVESTAVHDMIMLEQNDYLEIYVGNITDTDDFTIKTMQIQAVCY